MLYFLPKYSGVPDLAAVKRRGLAYAFESPSIACNEIMGAGPDGGPGVVCAVGGDGVVVTQPAEEVTWQKHETDDYWVGLERPHAPEDLAREEMLPGHLVTLADGRQWLAPVARGAGEEDGKLCWYECLPQRLTKQDGRWIGGDVLARYEPLWVIARGLMEDTDAIDVFDAAIAALGFNYRIGPVEVELLGLLDFSAGTSVAGSRVVMATIDGPRREELLKKRALTPTTDAGEPDSGEDTGPR